MRFWDSSAVLATILREEASDVVRALLKEDDRVAAWWGTPIECAASLLRHRRAGDLTTSALDRALDGLRLSSSGWREVPASQELAHSAIRVLRIHALRTGDALQLAAALEWAERAPSGLDFVTLDDELARAAALEGFRVLPAGVAV